MGRYDFEEELSNSDADDDDLLQDDIRALSMACMPPSTTDATATINNNNFEFSDSDSDDDSSDDDLELFRSIRERYGSDVDVSQPMCLRPLSTLPPVVSDDEDDDFETLRAIQRRFSQYYDGGDVHDSTDGKDSSFHDKSHQDYVDGTSLGNVSVDKHGDDVGPDISDAAKNVETSSCTPSFPPSAQTFMEAIKKNRSCQKFIRSKMLHIEARKENIKELQKRLKTLRDFKVQCKKNISRALSQKQDARVQLISASKQRATSKGPEKNVSAVFYGPLENSHVALYKTALENFPLSFQREKWANDEAKALKKEIKKQFQESLFNKSADVISALEEPGFNNGVDGMISSITNLEITPEIIQDFSGKIDWNQLASRLHKNRFPRRSGAECEARWFNFENCLINRDKWTSDEDKHLLLLIQKNGIHNWSYITKKLKTNRTPFQCLVRYQRSLNASILKRDWTEDEDTQLRSAVESFGGSNWQAVASVLEGRTGTQCSNRWNKTLLPARQRVGKWSIDEDKRLRVAVTLFGYKSWHRIAQFVRGRTQAQCRERWVNVLDPSLNRGQWTEEDDMRLKEAIAEHGYCWSKVAVCIPLRTDNQCRRRWKRLFPNEVPLLKAAKDIKKAALISNFVDRESERPALGADDFVPLLITDSINEQDDENVSQAQNKSRNKHADPASEFVSRFNQKRIRSRKRKKCDSSNECDDASSKNGCDALEIKKRRVSRTCSKKVKQTGSHYLATEPKKICGSTDSKENRELEILDNPICTRLRSPRGDRLRKKSLSGCCGVVHDGIGTNSLDSACSSKEEAVKHQQKSRSHLDQSVEWEDLPLVSIMKNKMFSKLQPKGSSLAKTTHGDNNPGAMGLGTWNDADDIHSRDAAGSKESDLKQQKKSRLHLNQSVEWEDLPLAVLFRRTVTAKNQHRPPLLQTYSRKGMKGRKLFLEGVALCK